MTKDEQIRAFLATRGATVCPPASDFKATAKSLRQLRNEQEAALMAPEEEDLDCEQRAERDFQAGVERRYHEIQGNCQKEF